MSRGREQMQSVIPKVSGRPQATQTEKPVPVLSWSTHLAQLRWSDASSIDATILSAASLGRCGQTIFPLFQYPRGKPWGNPWLQKIHEEFH